jgi:hypothetical protein
MRLDGVDTVVLAYGGRAVDGLYSALKGRVPELLLVGDAMAPRLLHDALLEGTRAARRLQHAARRRVSQRGDAIAAGRELRAK